METRKSITEKNLPRDDPNRVPHTTQTPPYEEVDEIIERVFCNFQSVDEAIAMSWKWIDLQKNKEWLNPSNTLVDISSDESSKDSKKSSSSGSESSKDGSKESSPAAARPIASKSGSSSSGTGDSSESSKTSSSSSSSSTSSSSSSSSSNKSPVTKRPRIETGSSDEDDPELDAMWPESSDEGLMDNEDENIEETWTENPKHSIFNRKYVIAKFESHGETYLNELLGRLQNTTVPMKWTGSDIARLLHIRRISLKMRKAIRGMKEIQIPYKTLNLEIGNKYTCIFIIFASITDETEWAFEIKYWRKGKNKGSWRTGKDSGFKEIIKEHDHFDNNHRDIGAVQDLIYLARASKNGVVRDLVFSNYQHAVPDGLNTREVYEKYNRMMRESRETLKVRVLRMDINGFEKSQGYDNQAIRYCIKHCEPRMLEKLHIRNFDEHPRKLGNFIFLPKLVNTLQFRRLRYLDIQFEPIIHNWGAYRLLNRVFVNKLNVKDMEDIIDVHCAKPVERGEGHLVTVSDGIDERQFVMIARNNQKLICITDANQKMKQCRMYFKARQGWVIGICLQTDDTLIVNIVWPVNRNHRWFPDPLPNKVTGRVSPQIKIEPVDPDDPAPAPSTSKKRPRPPTESQSSSKSNKSKKRKEKKSKKKKASHKKSKKSKKTKGKR